MTPQQIELARKVANDINEGIDCGESRKELREVIATLADLEQDAFERGRQSVMALLPITDDEPVDYDDGHVHYYDGEDLSFLTHRDDGRKPRTDGKVLPLMKKEALPPGIGFNLVSLHDHHPDT